jgi:hypothetical protein
MHNGRLNSFIQLLNYVSAMPIELSNNDLTRTIIIVDSAAFAQKLGIHADTEVNTGTPSRMLLQEWDKPPLYRAREHGATYDHHVIVLLGS